MISVGVQTENEDIRVHDDIGISPEICIFPNTLQRCLL